MSLIVLLLLPFIGSCLAAVLPHNARNTESLLAGLVALIGTVQVALLYPQIAHGGVIREEFLWLPSLGLNFVLRMDGFAWLFSMLVLGIGTLVSLYARYYMSPDDPVPRFFAFFLAFMGAMLGLVISGNLIQIVFFWELTSLFSFLLIGYWHHRADARRGAYMALMVTGAGGLCLLAGVMLLGHVVGSYDLDKVLAAGDLIRAHALYPILLSLILIGALSKSAQFPFHFWLPHAMAAPTPVSAYLHSATMVKAGVFPAGAAVAVAVRQRRMVLHRQRRRCVHPVARRVLRDVPERPQGPAGLLDHQPPGPDHPAAGPEQSAGRRGGGVPHPQPRHVQGLAVHGRRHHRPRKRHPRYSQAQRPDQADAVHRHAWPWSPALPMAGVPLLNGFLSKEMFFAETVFINATALGRRRRCPSSPPSPATFSVAYSLRFTVDVFFGPTATDLPHIPHEPPRWMRAPVEFLVFTCLVVGIFPAQVVGPLLGRGCLCRWWAAGARLQPGDLARLERTDDHERGRHVRRHRRSICCCAISSSRGVLSTRRYWPAQRQAPVRTQPA